MSIKNTGKSVSSPYEICVNSYKNNISYRRRFPCRRGLKEVNLAAPPATQQECTCGKTPEPFPVLIRSFKENRMPLSIFVLIALVALLVFWAVGAYNRLVRLKNTIANAFGQIDVQLKRRYDLIPNLVEAAQKYLQHEQSTLEAVTVARNKAKSASDAVCPCR